MGKMYLTEAQASKKKGPTVCRMSESAKNLSSTSFETKARLSSHSFLWGIMMFCKERKHLRAESEQGFLGTDKPWWQERIGSAHCAAGWGWTQGTPSVP